MFRSLLLVLSLVGCSGDSSTDSPTTDETPVDDMTGGETGSDTGKTTTTGSPPEAPTFVLSFSPVKQLELSWSAVDGATSYRLFERPAPSADVAQLGPSIEGSAVSHTVPLHLRVEASYTLSACNGAGCTDSAPVAVTDAIVDAVGYVKASNTGSDDGFGHAVAISDDGATLAVGAPFEDGSATVVDGADDDDADDAGAVYVFSRDGDGSWSQTAYLKASHGEAGDQLGHAIALSADGRTMAVSATGEDGGSSGTEGDPASNAEADSGAVYVFVRDGNEPWAEQAYLKASNTDSDDEFGFAISLSHTGDTLAVGAQGEDGAASGVGAKHDDESLNVGAAYLFTRSGTTWAQEAYVKPSNPDSADFFGSSVALSGDGATLAVGSTHEDGPTPGIDGAGGNEGSTTASGAVYVFVDGSSGWAQEAYVKASNVGRTDNFGASVALSDDGDVLAVGAAGEGSSSTGVGGAEDDDAAQSSGAVYVFGRDAGGWEQTDYVKASNTGVNDNFGASIALSGDGTLLAVSAPSENSLVVGLHAGAGGTDEDAGDSGAVYVFANQAGAWSQRSYVKAPNPDRNDDLGGVIALDGEGATLAVGAVGEDSEATGLDGDQKGDGARGSGAAYLY